MLTHAHAHGGREGAHGNGRVSIATRLVDYGLKGVEKSHERPFWQAARSLYRLQLACEFVISICATQQHVDWQDRSASCNLPRCR
jgi:hypothetical protein